MTESINFRELLKTLPADIAVTDGARDVLAGMLQDAYDMGRWHGAKASGTVMPIDWHLILLRYIDHVLTEEGTTFREDSYEGLSTLEANVLNGCIEAVWDQDKHRRKATEVTDYADTIKEIEALSTPFLDKAKKGIL